MHSIAEAQLSSTFIWAKTGKFQCSREPETIDMVWHPAPLGFIQVSICHGVPTTQQHANRSAGKVKALHEALLGRKFVGDLCLPQTATAARNKFFINGQLAKTWSLVPSFARHQTSPKGHTSSTLPAGMKSARHLAWATSRFSAAFTFHFSARCATYAIVSHCVWRSGVIRRRQRSRLPHQPALEVGGVVQAPEARLAARPELGLDGRAP